MKANPQEPNRRIAFEALYAAHHREVCAVAYARSLDSELAFDITQEAFARLWNHWAAGDESILNPRAWLFRVARNLAEDDAKSAFRRNGTQGPTVLNGVFAGDPSPLDRLAREETFAKIRAILAEMPEADRDILTLRYALDYDTDQIAEALDIAPSAVYMRLSRARQRIAERLAALGIKAAPS